MKKSKKIVIGAYLLCIFVTAIVYPFLPNQMPMQFSLSGEVNYTFPKYLGVWAIPLLSLGIALWQNYQEELDTKNAIMIACLLAFNCCFISIIAFLF